MSAGQIIYDVEVLATVRQWYTVEARSEEEARNIVLTSQDGEWPISEEVLELEIVNVAEEFDQDFFKDDEDAEFDGYDD